ncbi:MAG: PPC domain-containing protein [Verrucomicrobiae bacterium]|nr:PPC domain-containing protein [Verrucomicrobiae bacterium]
MNSWRWFLWALAGWLAVASGAQAQQQALRPSIGYVYPAGGQTGTTFQVTFGGQMLDGVTNAFVSGKGVQATVLEHRKLMTQNEVMRLRDRAQELMKQRNKDAATWKELEEIRKKIAGFIRRPASRAIAEQVVVQVTMAPDATPGEREIRLATAMGLTNPLVFHVGQLPEVSKKPAPVSPEQVLGQETQRFRYGMGREETPVGETRITIPATINGQVRAGGVDHYRFQARKGQQLVIAAQARSLVPYISDAVPGWFQATLTLYDAKGVELAYDDDFRFHPDPVLFYRIPADGEYVIEIKDAIYRGREDFVYRVTVAEQAFVTSIFPLGGPAGERTTVELKGWNLPVDKLVVDAQDKQPGILPVFVRQGDRVSNIVPFAVDTLPECLEKEPNNSREGAHKVVLPIIVNGRIDQRGDVDVFSFEGRAGAEVVAEVHARRLDSPVDSMLKLFDSSGRQLAMNDDHEDKGSGLNTHHADSYLRVRLPADGTYYVQMTETQRKGGPEFAYRLRISPPRPDFELRVTPSSINARAFACTPITVYALRKDGFAGDITLALKDAPAGFTLSGGWVPETQQVARLTLSVPPMFTKEPITLVLEGRATIEGREVVRQAVPAEDMMQAFAYRHLVPAQEMKVAVAGLGPGRFASKGGGRFGDRRGRFPAAAGRLTPPAQPMMKVLSKQPVQIPAGGSAQVRVAAPALSFMGKVELELSEPPDGIGIKNVSVSRDATEFDLQADAAKIKPGLKGNLLVNIIIAPSFQPPKGAKGPAANMRRFPVGTLPAIPFEVVAVQ